MLKNLILNTVIKKLLLSLRSASIITGILTVVFQDTLGLSPQATTEIVALIISFVFADTVREKK